jgi:hypothetical protein
MVGIYSLQQSSEQAEEALAQGLQQLHQSLADTVAAGTLNDGTAAPNYMGLMAIALEKLASLESFYQQVSIQSLLILHCIIINCLKLAALGDGDRSSPDAQRHHCAGRCRLKPAAAVLVLDAIWAFVCAGRGFPRSWGQTCSSPPSDSRSPVRWSAYRQRA